MGWNPEHGGEEEAVGCKSGWDPGRFIRSIIEFGGKGVQHRLHGDQCQVGAECARSVPGAESEIGGGGTNGRNGGGPDEDGAGTVLQRGGGGQRADEGTEMDDVGTGGMGSRDGSNWRGPGNGIAAVLRDRMSPEGRGRSVIRSPSPDQIHPLAQLADQHPLFAHFGPISLPAYTTQ